MADFDSLAYRIYGSGDGINFTQTGTEQTFTETFTESSGDNLFTTSDTGVVTTGDGNTYTFVAHFVDAEGNLFLLFNNQSNPGYVLASGSPHIAGPTGTLGDFPDSFATTDPGWSTDGIACFGAGTGIATPTGEIAVEHLAIGDLVTTDDGRQVPVKWIGHATVPTRFEFSSRWQPVRIAAGALGQGWPHSDLIVTGDHAIKLDGYMVNAAALVNGGSVDFVASRDLPELVTYYHVETEDHDAILANGLPAETFVDAAERTGFANYQEYLDLYGADRIIPEMQLPRITSARLLPVAVRQRLDRFAAAPVDVARSA